MTCSFSNRCFFTKAISIWTSTGDTDHVWIVGSYFHYAKGFEPPEVQQYAPHFQQRIMQLKHLCDTFEDVKFAEPEKMS